MKNIVFFVQKTRSLFEKIIFPKSKSEDSQRREFILNVLLFGLITLLVITNGIVIVQSIVLENYRGISPFITGIVFLCFTFLYFLSRKGFVIASAYLLIGIFLFAVTSTIYIWGVQLPTGLLSYSLTIVIAGVLINARFAFLTSLITSAFLFIIGYLHTNNIVTPNYYWKDEVFQLTDIIAFAILFGIFATVSWLSNREIEKSLARARRSEADLKKERDSLEITVEKRTRELKETQTEKMTQLYRFAEFGRLSTGLFHDLINPLTAVSLNIEKIKNLEQNMDPHIEFAVQKTDVTPISETAIYIDKAIVAARKMEDMVSAVRKQLSRQETKTLFSVNEEIAQAFEVLSHKAQKSGVAIRLFSRQEIKTYGDAVKFNQVALNLVANAIDSYLPARSSDILVGAKEGLEKRDGDTRTVTMSLSQEGGVIIFEVKDRGIGISEENKPRLFEPFFTTKEEGYGLGIGLSMTKRIIEKDFGGSISVKSKKGEGSVFTVKFPQKDKELTAG